MKKQNVFRTIALLLTILLAAGILPAMPVLADDAGKQYIASDDISKLEASSQQAGFEVEKAFDGIEDDADNCWHTPWEGDPIPGFPHSVTVTLKKNTYVDSLTYVARSATGYQFVTKYEIWVSTTDSVDDLEKVAEGAWSRAKTATAEFDPVDARIIRFVALEKVDSNPGDTTSVSASEIKIGLADMSAANRDREINAQLARVEAALELAEGDVGTQAGQYNQTAFAALETNQTELQAMLGKNYTEMEIKERLAASEERVLALLLSCGEALTGAAAIPGGVITATANSQAEGYEASKAVDGSTSTMWHTQWEPAVAERPHTIQLDLGRSCLLDAVTVTPRQDMSSGYILKGEVWTGDSADSLTKAADFLGTGTAASLTVPLPLTQARYVKIVSNEGTDSHTAISEIQVMAYDFGWIEAVHALHAAWYTYDNAQVGEGIGQFTQGDKDAYGDALEALEAELKAPAQNSAYVALAEEIQQTQQDFAAKAKKYSREELQAQITAAEALLGSMTNAQDKAMLQAAIDEAQKALTGTSDEIHQATLALLAVMDGAAASEAKTLDLSGAWQLSLSDYTAGMAYSDVVTLPGTLDTNRKGTPDTYKNPNRLSRYFTYTGAATYERTVFAPNGWSGKQVTLYLERSRLTKVYVNGAEVEGSSDNALPVAQTYDLSGALVYGQSNQLTIVVDNSYPNMPAAAITYSSTATEETQTNWNGIVGKLELQIAPAVSIDDVRVYPNDALTGATVELDLANIGEQKATDTATLEVDGKSTTVAYSVDAASTVTVKKEITIDNPQLWSEFDPYLYTLTASLENGSSETVSFGISTPLACSPSWATAWSLKRRCARRISVAFPSLASRTSAARVRRWWV